MSSSTVVPVAVLGASGYGGVELTRLLAGHPGVRLAAVASDRWIGDSVAARIGLGGDAWALRYQSPADAEAAAHGCAIAFLATPAEVSCEVAPRLVAAGVRVIDLSGGFRLPAASYPAVYRFTHPAPGLIDEAVYGLPELGDRAAIARARLVANPGCFATAASLALAPLVRAGVLADERLIVDAASGVTGAGRKASEEFSFAEIADDLRAYRVLSHQHTPEIAQTLGATAPLLTFTPHLLPLRRGILATCHARLAIGRTAADVTAAFAAAYDGARFIERCARPEDVTLHRVVGTNRCAIGVAVGAAREIVVCAALDNLVKGAAGQALQNCNLMLGLDEATGLGGLRPFHP
jgi:N-acetyl-gamma-glutamyl-phosphate reductase